MKKPRQLRFDAAKSDVLNLFREHPRRVFSYSDLQQMLEENREYWRLTKGPKEVSIRLVYILVKYMHGIPLLSGITSLFVT
jgi:hypothetical protein